MNRKSNRRARLRRWIACLSTSACVVLPACNRAEPDPAAGQSSPTAQSRPVVPPTSIPTQSNGGVAENTSPSNEVLPPSTSPGTSQSDATPVMPVAADNSQPAAVKPGIHIELTTPSLPSTGADAPLADSADALTQRLSDRFFMKLTLPISESPQDWLNFFVECDRAVQDLVITNQAQQLSREEFLAQAKRLSGMKLQAAEKLLATPGLPVKDQRAATAARIESLSQLSGLGDVDAATKLQAHASELTKSNDPEFAHQGRLVLLGFRLNQLQEGVLKDPQELLRDAEQLFARPEDRSLVEIMALQQCADVLGQLGFANESKQLISTIVRHYRGLPDKELSMRAWALETRDAPELAALHEAHQATLAGKAADANALSTAAQAFVRAYPTMHSLVHCCRLLIDIEFSGNVAAAAALGQTVDSMRSAVPTHPLAGEIETFLDYHKRRLSLRGKPLVLEELEGFDGKPFDWAAYRGRVVMICFWSSTAIHSLDELQRLKDLRKQIPNPDFQIVGINVDEPLYMSGAEQMVTRQAMNWQNLRSSNPNAMGFGATAARALGVNAVPFMLLVDRTGAVRAIHSRAATSTPLINELLAEPATPGKN